MKAIVMAGMCLVGLPGCGDALAPGEWLGEELLRIEGTVQVDTDESAGAAPGALRMAVFWSKEPLAEASADPIGGFEHQAVTTAEFPSRFVVSLHTPPPSSVLRDVPDGTGRYAAGMLVVYIDADRDGRWTADRDTMAGGARDLLIVYTPGGLVSEQLGPLDRGYHVLAPGDTDGCTDGTLRMKPAPTEGVRVSIDLATPETILLDLDCDPAKDEWGWSDWLEGVPSVDSVCDDLLDDLKLPFGLDPCDFSAEYDEQCCR